MSHCLIFSLCGCFLWFGGGGGVKGRLQPVLSESCLEAGVFIVISNGKALCIWWLYGIQGEWKCCDRRGRSDPLLNSTGWYEKAQWQKTERVEEQSRKMQLYATVCFHINNSAKWSTWDAFASFIFFLKHKSTTLPINTWIPEINQGLWSQLIQVSNCVSKAGKHLWNPPDGTSESDAESKGRNRFVVFLNLLLAASDRWEGFHLGRIPENDGGNTWSPPCGRGGPHSYVQKKKVD